jgi:hypothetical protein
MMGMQGLIVNPFARVERTQDRLGQPAFQVLAPRPGRSLSDVEVTVTDPAFHAIASLFNAKENGRFSVPRADVSLLSDLGLVLDAGAAPAQPTFRPFLTAFPNAALESDRVALAANGNFKSGRQITPLEAGEIIRCVPEPDDAIWHQLAGGPYIPYFLSDEMRDDVEALAAHSLVYTSQDHAQALMACGFAVPSPVKDPNVPPLPAILVKAALDYYHMLITGGFCRLGNAIRRHYLIDDPVGSALQSYYLQDVQRCASFPIERYSTYFSGYRDEAVLKPHLDPEEYDIAVSVMLRYSAPVGEPNFRWPLILNDGQRVVEVCQEVGEAVAIHSRRIVHSRSPLPSGHECDILLLHYTQSNKTDLAT